MRPTQAILPLVLIHTVIGGSAAVGRSILLGMGRVKAFTAAALIAGVMNAVLSYVFKGSFGWGLKGIVLGTRGVFRRCGLDAMVCFESYAGREGERRPATSGGLYGELIAQTKATAGVLDLQIRPEPRRERPGVDRLPVLLHRRPLHAIRTCTRRGTLRGVLLPAEDDVDVAAVRLRV